MGDFTPEDRQLLVSVAKNCAATEATVRQTGVAHRREIDALASRVTEVKADLEGDIEIVHTRIAEVRKSIRRVSSTIGAIASAIVAGGVQGVRSVLGVDG